MRIGLILFGHLRSYRQTHDSFLQLKKLLQQDGNIVDVFCHTWDIEESVTAAWWKSHRMSEPPPATVYKKEIISRYEPQAYLIESSRQFDEPVFEIKSLVPLAGMISMLYSQLKAFEILKDHESKTDLKYDVVIKTRFDLLYEIGASFSQLPKQSINDNCLFLPSSNPYELAGAYSDIFALGPGQLMEEYFKFNKNLSGAVACYAKKGFRELIPELLMSVYLKGQQMKIKEVPAFRIHILRMSGDKFQINTAQDFTGNAPLCFYKSTVEKCKELVRHNREIINENNNQLVNKYLSWLDKSVSKDQLYEYARFCNGEWMPLQKTRKLARLSHRSKLFAANVMRDFFEIAISNSKYGFLKQLAQATVLSANGYGSFYFKVIKNKILN